MPTYRARRGPAFDEQERRAMLERFRQGWQMSEAAADERDAGRAAMAREVMSAAGEEYIDGVPIVALSRSPLSGGVFETSLDIFGIDGLWWAYDYDYRPYVEPEPTFFAWTGALKLDGPLPAWSLKTMTGPEVPFVLPRILGHPSMRAVVSSVLIGEHVGFPIVYFAEPTPHELERVDDWGHRFYSYVGPDGRPGTAHSTQDDADKDFELGPWLEQGKLSWIEPGDLSLTLRSGREGCPYLGLPGERRRRYIQAGRSWLA